MRAIIAIIQLIFCTFCHATTEHESIYGRWRCKKCGNFNS